MRQALCLKHYSYRTEEAHSDRVRRYIFFHNKHHPAEMGAPEIQAFLTLLAMNENIAASIRNQALSAIIFLIQESRIQKQVTCHTLRHGFATHLFRNSCDIHTMQELLGRRGVRTTIIYTHVLNRGPKAVRSPLDK